ncbi:TonB-dependent receptor plug domain-containing protein [Carboxylicivirga caseinilyticus]|uniref:TonB-dependent receptor plug domain-containing protein n=1 Tax=Carboxylicivirga caseinilyticus TaxID=3417572 RepID=UPI003D3372A4|nr:TonB-dependent receptor [Marinilabiliaceae bacterium A049]
MNYLKRLLIGGFLSGMAFLKPVAQSTDTLIVITEVNITENRLSNFNAGSTVYQPNQQLLMQRSTLGMDEVLQFLSPMNIDAYGTGSSSINARGAGSNRTPILWNGFNLQSIANGGTDISTLPLLFSDDIKMEMGGNSALFGSGAVGGVIYLNNKARYNEAKKSFMTINAGSFGRFNGASGIQYGNKNYSGVLRTYYQQADNDFPFTGDYTSSGVTTTVDKDLPNANMHQFGVMSNNHFRLKNGQNISIHLWYQDVDKQIAPTVRDMARGKTSDAEQRDQAIRGAAEWKAPLKNGVVTVRTALFSTETNYQKPSTSDTTKTTGLSSINEAELDLNFTPWLKWNLGLNYTYEKAESSSYEGEKGRNRFATFTSFGIKNKKSGTFVTLNGRGEKAGDSDFTITGNIGLTQKIVGGLSAKAKAGTSYRIPTFNDLYWSGGTQVGNPNLEAETGFNYEAGLHYEQTVASTEFQVQATWFKNSLEKWISWGQLEDGTWTVFNQDKAEIQGLEIHAGINTKINKASIGCNINYTNQDAVDPDTENLLPYVPKSKTAAAVFGEYRGLRLIYAHSFVDERYTSASNSTLMPKYNIGNLSFEKRFDGQVETALTFKINNIWDTNYQTRQYYPMPGRYFLLGIQLSLN